eukprot:CAMPEP_0177672658 /NCGR_PEP_ID=MMETSP0447-20121125/25474_1 /TAXON_ID=0 /ORGANISM="Stygamoeba regulata, Strain BSH-02190019" /LENGTH=550 /DNA_ID=CAMNT_0019180371 /DNA_START=235 /DNA_END=1884 /DNA_ORIENTATION=-
MFSLSLSLSLSWSDGTVLGSGSFADVYLGIHTGTGEQVAIKVIDVEKLRLKNAKITEHLKSEIRIMVRLQHNNILDLRDVHHRDNFIFLALEYCRGGDLAKLLRRQPDRKLSEQVAFKLIRQLALGLKFMGHHHIMHRDLKPQNLLLTTEDPTTAVLKIADFGFARFMGSPSANAETLCGSPLYMAPEVLCSSPYTSQADLWSVGVILYEMVCGTPPVLAPSPFELIRLLKEKEIVFTDPFFRTCSPACANLIHRLLKKDPDARISFEDFFAHPWLALTKQELSDAIPLEMRPELQPEQRPRSFTSPVPRRSPSHPIPDSTPSHANTPVYPPHVGSLPGRSAAVPIASSGSRGSLEDAARSGRDSRAGSFSGSGTGLHSSSRYGSLGERVSGMHTSGRYGSPSGSGSATHSYEWPPRKPTNLFKSPDKPPSSASGGAPSFDPSGRHLNTTPSSSPHWTRPAATFSRGEEPRPAHPDTAAAFDQSSSRAGSTASIPPVYTTYLLSGANETSPLSTASAQQLASAQGLAELADAHAPAASFVLNLRAMAVLE